MSSPASEARAWWRDSAILVVLAVALALRLAVVAWLAHEPGGTPDPAFYWNAGRSIAEGTGYQSPAGFLTAYFPPGYPYFLGAVMAAIDALGLQGMGASVIGATQAVLGTGTVLLVILTGRLLGGRRLGLVAGAVLAIWPNIVAYSAAFLSETLYLGIFAVFMYASVRMVADGSPSWGWTVMATASLGASALVRPQILLAVPLLVVAWLIAGMGWRRAVLWALALVAGTLLVIAPWAARNASVFGQVVPVSTNGGVNLCIGFSDRAWGGFHLAQDCTPAESYSGGPASELTNDRILTATAREWIAEHPGQIPTLSILKLRYTFWPDNDGFQGIESYGASPAIPPQVRGPMEFTANIYYAAIALLAVAGFVILTVRCAGDRSRQAGGWVLLALTVAAAIVPAMVFGDPRFKVPVAPQMAILAAVTLVTLAKVLLSRDNTRTSDPEGSRTGDMVETT